jgi:hypothetical protein
VVVTATGEPITLTEDETGYLIDDIVESYND